jgi:hypothetical protein
MNHTHPADFCPLAYGAGLALGLMLIIGLPTAVEKPVRETRETLEVPAAADRPGEKRPREAAAMRP